MKKFLVILLALSLAGCVTGCAGSMAQKPIDNLMDWTGFVAPKDSVPVDCTQAAPAEPKMPETKGMTAKDAARADREVRLAFRKLKRKHKRCQTWAKGQR